MNVLFDQEQLARLITSLQTLTGIRANILDAAGRDIGLTVGHTAFCRQINEDPAGHARCLACDAAAARVCAGQAHFYYYRCHIGLCEAMLPLYADDPGVPVAYLILGQFLETAPNEARWQGVQGALGWYAGDLHALRQSFFALRCYPQTTLQAYAEVVEALADYIRLKGMILPTGESDLRRLELYLNEHYTEKLSLALLCDQLKIGRTRLCRLARELSGGHTLSWLIAQRRIEAAKALLLQTSMPISAVAEAVGISDYNYFSRLFRTVTGLTPRKFRLNRDGTYKNIVQNGKNSVDFS